MNAGKSSHLIFLWPWAVGLLCWTALPTGLVAMLSMLSSSGSLSSPTYAWTGWSNYRACLELSPAGQWQPAAHGARIARSALAKSFTNSLVYSLVAVPSCLLTALVVALLLNRAGRGMALLRILVYLPNVLTGVAAIIIWSWVLNPRFGVVNRLIRALYAWADPLVRLVDPAGTGDWPTPDWLYSPIWCKPALVLIDVWTVGGAMLVFLAALRQVPRGLYEAADLDGATWWHRFWKITWPQITPAVWFNLLISWVFTMQTFTQPYLLRNRRQDDGLVFAGVHLYQLAFEPPYRLGQACAAACLFFIVLLITVAPIVLTTRRWVYEAWTRS